jgi:hypothetical protein
VALEAVMMGNDLPSRRTDPDSEGVSALDTIMDQVKVLSRGR